MKNLFIAYPDEDDKNNQNNQNKEVYPGGVIRLQNGEEVIVTSIDRQYDFSGVIVTEYRMESRQYR